MDLGTVQILVFGGVLVAFTGFAAYMAAREVPKSGAKGEPLL